MAIYSGLLAASEAIESRELPNGTRWWKGPEGWPLNAGQTIFPVYGPTGGLRAEFVAYLVKGAWHSGVDMGTHGLSQHGDTKVFAISIHPNDSKEDVSSKIDEAIKALNGD